MVKIRVGIGLGAAAKQTFALVVGAARPPNDVYRDERNGRRWTMGAWMMNAGRYSGARWSFDANARTVVAMVMTAVVGDGMMVVDI